ncbi:outer membrane beta-barrel protein [Anderseniella sp. Alg231-50]|uniref:outer membrane beta-barrel protein n=1 Tax=Anderseniella sp. Alg231-50 TaxID=1922226 RepID=UPI000D551589
MKKYLLAAAACVSSIAIGLASASADELPQWNGLYGGVNVGIGHSGSDSATGTARIFGRDLSVTRSFDLDTGLIGGAQLGYNLQHDRFVFGLEADFNGADLSTEPGSLISFGPLQLGTFTSDVNWFGTARARAGILLDDDFLFYATGGLAYGEVSNSFGVSFRGRGSSVSNTDIRLGWTAGAGVETMLRSNMKLKLEYLYVDLGSDTVFEGRLFVPVSGESDVSFHAARVGLNIDFDTPLFGQ